MIRELFSTNTKKTIILIIYGLLILDFESTNSELLISMSLLPIVWYNTPRVIYINAKTDVKDILDENTGKSGIYIWINKLNGKQYVGSSINLGDKKNRSIK
jgi:hypothetical protein